LIIGPPCRDSAKTAKLIGLVHITAQTTIGDDCTLAIRLRGHAAAIALRYRGELTKLTIG